MKGLVGVAAAALLIAIWSSGAYADPPHRGGLPPGLQKKLERGEPLPPGWRDKAGVYDYGYAEPYGDRHGDQGRYYDEYGYADPYNEQYGYPPEYPEDKVYRIIKDVRDLLSPAPQ